MVYLKDENRKLIMVDLIILNKKIKLFKVLKVIIWFINFIFLLLSIIPFFIYHKIILNYTFVIFTVFNLISFYATYLITNKLKFLKYKFKHFSNLN